MRRLLAVVLGALLWPSLVFAQGEIRRPALSPVDPTCTSSSAPSRTPLAGALLTCRDGSVYVGDGADWIGLGGGFSGANPLVITSTGTAASHTTAFADPNANLIWTADNAGHAGNDLQIEYVDPGMASQSLSASYDTDTKVLTISLATGASSSIETSSVDVGGAGYAVNDTAFVLQVTGLTINAVNQSTKTFTLDFDTSSYDAAYFNHMHVSGSTGNDGAYTVASLSGFDVTVNEAIPSAVADGSITGGSATIRVETVSSGAITAFTVTDPGEDYGVDSWSLVNITGSGSGASINIDSVSGGGGITTTAQDILDLGAYDGAPMSPALAPGSDGSGVVEGLSPQNLAGGLEALNVTGASSLDNGAITTNGSGTMQIGNDLGVTGDVLAGNSFTAPASTDVNVTAPGGQVIKLNSDTVFGTLTGTGEEYACIDATGKLVRRSSACGS